jgi:WD40 repeat protein
MTTTADAAAPASATPTFDAFISYSHAADGRLAPALQDGLQSMAKPWYRRRALRIFRDQTTLSASPELWGSIAQALASSRAFILLAAPESAASPWVEQEAAWWRTHREGDGCLIALTGGELAWDQERGDFSAGSSVPPSLRGWFASEPLWVDLRWARTEVHLSLRNPRFRDCVANLAAPLRGTQKDELVGEDIRLHRRALRLARTAVALLVVLVLLAVAAAVVAVGQRNTARDESSLATARQIAATSTSNRASRLDIANGLAAEGYARRATDQTEQALLGAVTASPHLVRVRSNGSRVTALTPVSAGDRILVGDAAGRVRPWSLRDGGFGPALVDTTAPVSAVRLSPTGDLLMVGDESGRVVVRDLRDGSARSSKVTGVVAELAEDDAGRRLAVGSFTSTGDGALALFDLRTGALVRRIAAPFAPDALRFSDDGRTLMVGDDFGDRQWVTVPDLAAVGKQISAIAPNAGPRRISTITPDAGYPSGYSPDRRYFGFYKSGLTVVATSDPTGKRRYPLDTTTVPSALAIAPDASRVAVAAGGTIAVVRPRTSAGTNGGDPGGLVADAFDGVSRTVTELSFAGSGRRLISAAGDLLALWDPAQRSRLARRVPIGVADVVSVYLRPGLALSGDGRRVATGGENEQISVTDLGLRRTIGSPTFGSQTRPYLGVLLDHRGRTATVISGDDVTQVDVNHGTPLGSVRVRGTQSAPPLVALVPGPRDRPVVVASDGSVVGADVPGQRVDEIAGAIPHRPLSLFNDGVATVPTRGVLYEALGHTLWSVDLATGRRTPWAGTRGEDLASVAASGDGRMVVTSDGESGVQVWDVAARRVVRTLDTGPVSLLRLDDRALHLAAVQTNGTISVWRPKTATKLGDLPLGDPQTGIERGLSDQTRVVFGRDGTLLTATTGAGLYAWSMSPATWTRTACATVGRSLTRDEWQRYVGIAYKPRSPC